MKKHVKNLVLAMIMIISCSNLKSQEMFQPDWESLSKYQCPEWYKDAKFGIFIHWGVYSVPAFGTEWYPRWMYKDTLAWGVNYFHPQIKRYGTQDTFGYKNFIPLFKAEKFNPEQWAEIFKKSGAKYVIPVAEHHDGFAMYNTSMSKWNAYNMGPKRDILGELAKAVRNEGLIFGLSSHRAEHWWFMNTGRLIKSDVNDPKYNDFYGPATIMEPFDSKKRVPMSHEYMSDWLLRCCELVDKYHPQIFWFDWYIEQAEMEPYRKTFAAYYYNHAMQWKKEVVINYKDNAYPENVAVYDIERGSSKATKKFPWQTDTSVGKKSWGYIEGEENKSPQEIIDVLLDVVSKNGNLLLNIGPKSDGTIPQEQINVLQAIGKWLDVNGEGIFGTRPWIIAEEGPTAIHEGTFGEFKGIHYTENDFRFTSKKDTIYVFCLVVPKSKKIVVKSLSLNSVSGKKIKNIYLLGSAEKLKWTQRQEELVIETPKNIPCENAIGFKIIF